MTNIVLFDGHCSFCDASVRFIIQRDPSATFHFASLQSDVGQQLVQSTHIQPNTDSLILIEGKTAYTHSTAALRIAKRLHRLWPLLYVCILIPRPIRDGIYRYIAKNRYKWFARKEQACELPPDHIRNRFL